MDRLFKRAADIVGDEVESGPHLVQGVVEPFVVKVDPNLFAEKIQQELRVEPADLFVEFACKVGFDLFDQEGFLFL